MIKEAFCIRFWEIYISTICISPRRDSYLAEARYYLAAARYYLDAARYILSRYIFPNMYMYLAAARYYLAAARYILSRYIFPKNHIQNAAFIKHSSDIMINMIFKYNLKRFLWKDFVIKYLVTAHNVTIYIVILIIELYTIKEIVYDYCWILLS